MTIAKQVAKIEQEIDYVKNGDYTYTHKMELIRDLKSQILRIKLENSLLVDGEVNGAEIDNAA